MVAPSGGFRLVAPFGERRLDPLRRSGGRLVFPDPNHVPPSTPQGRGVDVGTAVAVDVAGGERGGVLEPKKASSDSGCGESSLRIRSSVLRLKT